MNNIDYVISSILNDNEIPDDILFDFILNSDSEKHCNALNKLTESEFTKYLQYVAKHSEKFSMFPVKI